MSEEINLGFRNISEEDAVGSVGAGWESLIRRLYAAKPDNVEVRQVKEKFGGLRFYTGAAPREYLDLIDQIENESYYVCYMCGEPGQVDNSKWWVLTLCPTHTEIRNSE